MTDEPPALPRCASCPLPRQRRDCVAPPGERPEGCPMTAWPEVIAHARQRYDDDEELRAFAAQASIQEAECYADRHARPFVKRPCKPRVEEIWEFAHRMGYRRLGLASCLGLIAEARTAARLFEAHDLEVVSVMCKVGAVPKERLGLRDEDKIRAGGHESICNPLAQALLLNDAGTELNVLLGLCVGHDSIFFKHCEAPCTVLAAKDRVLGHNPIAALYTSRSYYDRLRGD